MGALILGRKAFGIGKNSSRTRDPIPVDCCMFLENWLFSRPGTFLNEAVRFQPQFNAEGK